MKCKDCKKRIEIEIDSNSGKRVTLRGCEFLDKVMDSDGCRYEDYYHALVVSCTAYVLE